MRFVPVAKISFLVSFHGEVLVGWWSRLKSRLIISILPESQKCWLDVGG